MQLSQTDGAIVALTQALRDEERLLADLARLMRSQRDAITSDDIDALDDSVFSTHRVLLTLGEARRHRIALNHALGEGDDLSLQSIDDMFGGSPPTELRAAVGELVATGQHLQRELEINQRVLEVAFVAGDGLVRALYGVGQAPATYSSDLAHTSDGTMLDRRI
jgi:hypothetical protein